MALTKKISQMTAASALTGADIVPVVQSGGNKKATADQVRDYARKNLVVSATVSSGTLTVNCASADYFTHTLSENITAWTFSNLDGAGHGRTIMIRITQHAASAKTVAWPASFKWPNGVAPTLTSTLNAQDVFTFFTRDGGTTYYAFTSGQNL